jgi:lipopolysaccharide/colanic/teichoic acid biosynthesis glycosyltransferase
MAVETDLPQPRHAAPARTPPPATRRLDAIRPPPFVPPPRPLYDAAKEVADFILAAGLLVLAAPVMLLSALAVKLTSPGPVLYSQVRVGKNGRPFTLRKIRTMHRDCEKASGACWSTPGDPRVTPVGAFLRRTHLDELPQLWNVLTGHMSLVGPRPERPEFVPALAQQIPHYRDRLAVRPGVTGLAQVQLPADTDLDSVRRKLAYDLYYIRHRGFWLDLRLVVCTAVHMAGAPYRLLRTAFLTPRPAAVEAAFHEHARPRPQFGA